VPGDLAAPVDVHDGSAGVGDGTIPSPCALARRVNGFVLQEEDRIGHLIGDAALVEPFLKIPALVVRDGSVAQPCVNEITHTFTLRPGGG
jgi:hypothetical protein